MGHYCPVCEKFGDNCTCCDKQEHVERTPEPNELKVGDRVVRKEANRNGFWVLYCGRNNISSDSPLTITAVMSDGQVVFTSKDGSPHKWLPEFFEKVTPVVETVSAPPPAPSSSPRLPEVGTCGTAPEYSGGSSSYYTVRVVNTTTPYSLAYTAECNDIIEALGMNFAEGNAFKALWRRAAQRTLGKAKAGAKGDGLYDAEKVEFFGKRLVEQSKALKDGTS